MNRPKTLQEPETASEKAKRIRGQQCPQCGSLQWSLLGSARQCHSCGCIWLRPTSTSEGHAADSDNLNYIPEADQARQKLLRTAANFQAVEEMGAVPEVLRRMQKREKDAHNPPPASQEPLSCPPEPKEGTGHQKGKPDVDNGNISCQSQGMLNQKRRSHQKASDQELADSYAATRNVWKTADQFGMCGQSVHERLSRLGIIEEWKVTDEEKEKIRAFYSEGFINGDGKLIAFCKSLGRTKPLVSRLARKMGLTNAKRPCSEDLKKKNGDRVRAQWKLQPHPRGALGMKHTPETLDILSEKSKAFAAGLSNESRKRITEKTLRTKFDKYGSRAPGVSKGNWKAAWREIGGKRIFARSRWEANYARYLQFLKEQKQISEWEHEAETFWFVKIQRGIRSYLPDFRVTYWEGTVEYHEVKGWMDSRSKTTIRRMRIYHPKIVLRIIDAKWFKANGRKMAGLITGWEVG